MYRNRHLPCTHRCYIASSPAHTAVPLHICREGQDFKQLMDLAGLFRVWNDKYKSWSVFGQVRAGPGEVCLGCAAGWGSAAGNMSGRWQATAGAFAGSLGLLPGGRGFVVTGATRKGCGTGCLMPSRRGPGKKCALLDERRMGLCCGQAQGAITGGA